MVEAARAAGAIDHGMLGPAAREQRAAPAQIVGQRVQRRIVEMPARVGAELGEHTARAMLPIGNDGRRDLVQEHVAEQIAVLGAIEPADEQARRGDIPGARVPHPVEQIGRPVDRCDRLGERRRHVHAVAVRRRVGRRTRVALAGKLEEIGALGRGQLQRAGQAGERRRRRRDVAPLLEPGVPGGAHAAGLGDLLAAQPRRAAARAAGQPEAGRRQARALGPEEIPEHAPLGRRMGRHGKFYTRINTPLLPGSWTCYMTAVPFERICR